MRTREISSSEFIKPGIVLVRRGAQFPHAVELKSCACYPGWNVLESTGAEIDRQVTKAGWHFFWMAAVIERSAFAVDPGKAVRKALGQLLTEVGRLNAVEIENVRVKSFLGLHYATVRGHARHIQQSAILFELSHPVTDANAREAEKSMTVAA